MLFTWEHAVDITFCNGGVVIVVVTGCCKMFISYKVYRLRIVSVIKFLLPKWPSSSKTMYRLKLLTVILHGRK